MIWKIQEEHQNNPRTFDTFFNEIMEVIKTTLLETNDKVIQRDVKKIILDSIQEVAEFNKLSSSTYNYNSSSIEYKEILLIMHDIIKEEIDNMPIYEPSSLLNSVITDMMIYNNKRLSLSQESSDSGKNWEKMLDTELDRYLKRALEEARHAFVRSLKEEKIEIVKADKNNTLFTVLIGVGRFCLVAFIGVSIWWYTRL